jgi:hypothetical protein
MDSFFANLPFEKAAELAQLSQLMLELRNHRNAVLGHHGTADEAALLSRIESSAVDEHPAYEHYLAARILADTREAARSALAASLTEGTPP